MNKQEFEDAIKYEISKEVMLRVDGMEIIGTLSEWGRNPPRYRVWGYSKSFTASDVERVDCGEYNTIVYLKENRQD